MWNLATVQRLADIEQYQRSGLATVQRYLANVEMSTRSLLGVLDQSLAAVQRYLADVK